MGKKYVTKIAVSALSMDWPQLPLDVVTGNAVIGNRAVNAEQILR
jgi:hypothetical protein